MRTVGLRHLAGAALVGVIAVPLSGQQAQPAPAPGPPVGDMAPDFEFTGITRYGILAERHKLSDYRGSTVVLAFFPKARTKG